jgi:alpha-ribazole phosphatase/probable phosphoglycerate mutase
MRRGEISGEIYARLYLARHGETSDANNGALRFNGHIDVDLSTEGIHQMERIAEFLANRPIANVYSSDLIRSIKGANIIAGVHRIKVVSLSELREVNQGSWEGLTYEEVLERYPEEAERRFSDFINYRVPGGENLLDAKRRVIPKLKELIEINHGKEFVIVGHGGINILILDDALGLDLRHFFRMGQDFGCLNIIDYYEDIAIVRMMNGLTEGL